MDDFEESDSPLDIDGDGDEAIDMCLFFDNDSEGIPGTVYLSLFVQQDNYVYCPRNSHGAYDSQAIRNAKFDIAPKIKSLTVEYVCENQSEAEQYLDDEFRAMSVSDFLSRYLDEEECE